MDRFILVVANLHLLSMDLLLGAKMEFVDTAAILMDDLLDFSSDIGEECEDDDDLYCEKTKIPSSSFSLLRSCPVNEFVEEELEWISNKDAFPMVESFVDIIPNHPTSVATSTATTPSHHRSLVSVLENSSTSSMNSITSSSGSTSRNTTSCSAVSALISTFKVPGKARTKMGRKRRQDMLGPQWQCWPKQPKKLKVGGCSRPSSTLGRKCLHCQSEKTPQWRAGPLGPKTLCNACGVRYKSGRLVPEYRPASSPTFCSLVHSNSHRKIVEMRKQKMTIS